jgi:putative transposase
MSGLWGGKSSEARGTLGATDKARQAACRHLFRYHLDEEMVSKLRLAVTRSSSSGTSVSMTIERMAGQRREARPRGRPRLSGNVANEDVKGQGDLGLWQISSLASLTSL